MRNNYIYINTAIIAIFLLSYTAQAKSIKMFVRYNSSLTTSTYASLKSQAHITKIEQSYETVPGLQLVTLDSTGNIDENIRLLESFPGVLYAEPDYPLHALDITPNDPSFKEQWGLISMNMPAAWEISQGSNQVIVATIDTGIDYRHPDLASNIWQNKDEIPGNKLDDDDNGFIDDFYGVNMVNQTGDPFDDEGHGTHVAGIIAAQGNNHIGIAGVAWNTKILPCKFLDSNGSGNTSDAIACLDYVYLLKKKGVNIVATNNSYGGPSSSRAFYDAIRAQADAGILFITAAGNDGKNNDTYNSYPANYNLPNVISVAAVDKKGALASWSNRGSNTVHVGAPGVGILSTFPGNKYQILEGTSMATPYVTGLAALIKAAKPTLAMAEIRNLILTSGQPTHTLNQTTITGRQIAAFGTNGLGALQCDNQVVARLLSPQKNNIVLYKGESIQVSYLFVNCEKPALENRFDISGNNNVSLTFYDDGTHGDLYASDGVFVAQFTSSTPNVYQYALPDKSTLQITVSEEPQQYSILRQEYNYIPILGDKLSFQDEAVYQIKSPFPLSFGKANANYTTLYVSSNGTISLTDSFVSPSNKPLPLYSVQTLIAPYWTDLDPKKAYLKKPSLSYAVIGAAPNRQLVVEWRDAPHHNVYPAPGNAITFQVVFQEGSSDIMFNYKYTAFGNPTYDNAKKATVGVQVSPQNSSMFSINQGSLKDQTSLLLTTKPR